MMNISVCSYSVQQFILIYMRVLLYSSLRTSTLFEDLRVLLKVALGQHSEEV